MRTHRAAPARASDGSVRARKHSMTLDHRASGPTWSTSSYGEPAHTRPLDLHALGQHLHLCQGHSGRIFALRCGADLVHGFVAERFVTSLVVLVGVVCAGLVFW